MQVEPAGAAQKPAAPQLLASAALALVLVPSVASAAAPEWLEPVRSSLDIGLAVFSLFFFLRIPLTWYPNMDLNKAPQCIVAWPTEPFCKLVRGITPPLFGVDISPVVVYAVLSFIREIFLGQQGVLTMMANK
ncbi:hypothetical protein T484DRAFT_1613423 [Baffinella frigidus]|nr:hypothetical protein T484DRAFT_1613423 [Cryptophyta sp. CCMP2293]